MNRDDSHILNLLQAAIRQRSSQGKLFKVYVYAGKDIEKSQGYKKLRDYVKEKYKDPSNEIEFYTYEDVEGQDLQGNGEDQRIKLSYLSFEGFLDKIYNEAHN